MAKRVKAARRSMKGQPGLNPAAARLLRALAEPGASGRPDPVGSGGIMVSAARGDITLGRGIHSAAAWAELDRRGLAAPVAGGSAVVATEAGRALLRRAGAGPDPFGAQHRELVRETRESERDGPERLLVNAAESPLAWLRRRRGRDGEPLIDAAGFEAGERLRRDLTAAAMLPSVTARWDGTAAAGHGGLPRDPAAAADATLAARQRVRLALDAVGGGELAGLLLDLCGFLKGLEAIERDRGWPPRSGKVAARLALASLARHYGLAAEARGPAASRGVLSWAA